jgi:hypothetical protein
MKPRYIYRYHPQVEGGLAVFNPALHAYVLDEAGQPIPASKYTGDEAVGRTTYTPRTTKIGTLTLTLDEAGSVTLVDSATHYAPLIFVQSGKARAAFCAISRALRHIEQHPEIVAG